MAEAHRLRDEHGNPIQLTDQYGNPVKLTDEHGHPVTITGVATTATAPSLQGTGAAAGTIGATTGTAAGTIPPNTTGLGNYGGGATTNNKGTVADLLAKETPVYDPTSHRNRETTSELRRSNSSSSSSSEDDGQGGRRRKKKGLKDKIKEKLPGTGGKEHSQTTTISTGTTGFGASHPTTTTTGGGVHPEHHEKKGIIDKIKEKFLVIIATEEALSIYLVSRSVN